MILEKITLLQLFSQIVKQKLRSRRNILFLNWTAQFLISLCIFTGYLVRKRFGNCLPHVGGEEEEELNYLYVSAWCVRRETLLLVGSCGSFLWKCFKESTRQGKFFRKGTPLNVEILAVFQCDCTVLTAPENNAGFRGETGTKIFMFFLGWYINIYVDR